MLCKKFDCINFTIAGEIDENNSFARKQLEIVKKNNLLHRIKFLGYISDVDTLYAQSNLHVCPSVYDEPLANVLIDAKKHAVPSIIFSVGGLPEIIEHQVDGYICKDKNSLTLKKAIEYFFKNQNICINMGNNAFTSLKKLQIDKFPERWLNVFETTI